MSVFDQKLSFASRVRDWLFFGGWTNSASTGQLFRVLRVEFNSFEPQNVHNEYVAARLLPFRDEFRRIMQQPNSVALLQLHRHNANPLIRSIAIWLLSRHASRFFLLGIEDFCDDYSPLVRKRVARALRRL